MAVDILDRLLTTLAVRLHAFSVCEIGQRRRLAFPSFEAITVHYVLKGSGALRVGSGTWLPFGPQSVIIVPARQTHVLGDVAPLSEVVQAEHQCALLGDGLIKFTTGEGRAETLLVCGAISASYGGGLGLFGLLRERVKGSGRLSHDLDTKDGKRCVWVSELTGKRRSTACRDRDALQAPGPASLRRAAQLLWPHSRDT